jgi:hypothetical protein
MFDNIGRAFTFMFEDKDWVQKIILGAVFVLLSLLIIPIPFVLGYFLELARNTADGKPLPLPTWDQLGDKFLLGLLYFLAMLCYVIPLMIVNFLLGYIPCIGWLIGLLLSLALYLVLPYIGVQIARTGKIAPAFDFPAIIAFVSQNLVNLIIVILIGVVLSFLAGFGFIALVVGIFFTWFYAGLVNSYLWGEVVRVAEQGEATISVEDVPPSRPETPSSGDSSPDDFRSDDSEPRQQ